MSVIRYFTIDNNLNPSDLFDPDLIVSDFKLRKILCISLLRITVLSLTFIFSISSSQKKIFILCSMSLNMIVVLFQRYEFLISGQRQYMEKPKRT